ncbi:MAG: iron-sulfur cluster-binding protein [bacterium JZ-2024 1]
MPPRKANVFIPDVAVIEEKRSEPNRAITLSLRFLDSLYARSFDFVPGQYAILSVFGFGEEAHYFSSSPLTRGKVEVSIPYGTSLYPILYRVEKGSMIGVRGPVGKGVPMDELRGKHLYLFSFNGGLAPLRSVASYVVDSPADFERVTLVANFATDNDLMYSNELYGVWGGHALFSVEIGFDRIHQEGGSVETGGLKALIRQANPTQRNAAAIISGPPKFCRQVIRELEERDFRDAQMLVFVHRKITCGYGMCGSCRIGKDLTCLTGPVFPVSHLRKLPPEF